MEMVEEKVVRNVGNGSKKGDGDKGTPRGGAWRWSWYRGRRQKRS